MERTVQCNLYTNMRDLTAVLSLDLYADPYFFKAKPCSESEFHYRFITKIESLLLSLNLNGIWSQTSSKVCRAENIL